MYEILWTIFWIAELYLLYKILGVLRDINLWNERAEELKKLFAGIKEIDLDK
jgi:hypothetical protein